MALGLPLLSLAARFPFWFASVLDWDESTYVLMGQEVLDGRQPYVGLWENKPPLAFVAYALPLAVDRSIVAVRVAGALSVFATAYLCYLVTRRAGPSAPSPVRSVWCSWARCGRGSRR